MVSFSCENCGDVLTKKKLDPHRNQCRGATFTCLDCMVHFPGMDYRSHTSCISEAQKYHGALYKGNNREGKKSKPNGKTVTIVESALVPRKAYVEDAPDCEGGSVAIVDAPPHAPSPPPAAPPAQEQAALPAVNVFDFLVTEDTPNASRTTLAPEDSQLVTKEQMRMKEHAPGIFESEDSYQENGVDVRYDDYDYDYDYDDRSFRTAHDNYSDLHAYEDQGYSYGADPVPTNLHHDRQAYLTPAPRRETEHIKVKEKISKESRRERESKEHKKDKKRKRHPVEELDLSASKPSSKLQADSLMEDAPPVLLHSGLTGGLNRLLSKSDFPLSPDYSGADGGGASPNSPLKRSKHANTAIKTKTKDKNHITTLVKTRKPSSSSQETETEHRPRKHHRHHHHHRSHRSASPPHHKQLKAIEYPQPSSTSAQNGDNGALILYRSRAELFMSFINKGPDSEKGLSVNKALKRYHRERGEKGVGLGKGEEEKELWKGLRMKRNDRGEIVLFI